MLTAFKQYLSTLSLRPVSRKLYLSDIRRFLLTFSSLPTLDVLLNPTTYSSYLAGLKTSAIAPSMLKRTLASLRQFAQFLAITYHVTSPLADFGANRADESNQSRAFENYIKHFTNHLLSDHLSPLTIKSYKSDVSRYLDWCTSNMTSKDLVRLLTPENTQNYLNHLMQSLDCLPTTIARKSKSLARFQDWYFNVYMASSISDNIKSTQKSVSSSNLPPKQVDLEASLPTTPLIHSKPVKKINSRNWLNYLLPNFAYPGLRNFATLLVLLLFTATLSIFGYRQFSQDVRLTAAFPSTPITPNRQLSFQGRLENAAGTPITTATNLTFKLFDAVSSGTQLYTTGVCSITPDQDGVFSTQIGSTCGSAIASSVFSENANVWLEVTVAAETLTPRQAIASVAYALNSETIQGFPISSTVSAIRNTVVPMNQWGEIIVGEQNPRMTGVAGTFAISAPSLSFTTTTGSNGNITFAPDGTGVVNVNGNTTTTNFFNVSNAQLTTGSLITGTAANNNTGFKLLDLLSGSSPTSKFSVTDTGLTTIGADLYVSSGVSLYNTAVSDDTVEAAKFCTGDGETNCVTDFSAITAGSSYWTRTSGVLSPTNLNDVIAATTSATTAMTLTQTGAFDALRVEDQSSDTTPFVINQSGNVGIGTASPGTLLDIQGGTGSVNFIKSITDNTTRFIRMGENETNSYIDLGWNASNYGYLGVVGTNYPLVLQPNGGNVGIGTTASTAKLDVAGDASVSGHLVMRGAGTNYIHTLNGSNFGISTSVGGDTGLSEKLTILNSGNVGIGTTNPQSLLHIKNATSSTVSNVVSIDTTVNANANGGFELWRGAAGASTNLGRFVMAGYNDNFITGAVANDVIFSAPTANSLIFGNSATGAEWIRIANGRLSIGDTTPDAPLDVVGDAYISDGLSLFETAVSDGTVEATKFCTGDGETNCVSDFSTFATGINYWTRSAGNISPLTLNDTISATTSAAVALTLTQTGSFNALLVEDQASDTTPFAIDQNGNVGIGTATPSTALDVVGAINASSTITGLSHNTANMKFSENSSTVMYLSNTAGTGARALMLSEVIAGQASGTAPNLQLGASSLGLSMASSFGIQWSSTTGYSGSKDIGLSRLSAGILAVGNGTVGNTAGTLVASNIGIGDNSPLSPLTVGSGDLFQISSAGIITSIDGVAHTIDDVGGNLTLTSNSTAVSIADDIYLSSGLSTFGTAVSDGTVEATKFCTGDGETNCVTDFSSIIAGSGYWSKSAGNLYPTTLNDTISATTSAAVALTLTQTGAFNALLVEDQASDTTPFVIDQSGNVGIGQTTPGQKLVVGSITSQNTARINGLSTADMSPVTSLFRSAASEWIMAVGGANTNNFTIGANPASYTDANIASSAKLTINTSGNLGIGDTSPTSLLTIGNGDLFQINSSGIVAAIDGVAHTIDDVSGNLTLTSNSTAVTVADDLQITGGDILDSNGNESIRFGTTTSAVNELTVTNAATTGTVAVAATGGDTDVALNIDSKGADALNLNGVATGDINLAGGSGSTGCTVTNSTGNLTCTGTISGAGITASALKWNALTAPDGNLTLAHAGFTTAFTYDSVTTATAFDMSSTSLTSGKLLNLSSTSTALTTGNLLSLDWSPGSATTSTGDLFSLNIGANGTAANLFNIKNTGSSLFSVSETAVTSNLPTAFTASGDVSMAYDLNFTNPTQSTITSTAPLSITAGESFNSSNLTLKTYNSGDLVIDTPGGVTLSQAQTWDLANSSTSSLNIESGLLNLDTTNSRVGIGTVVPSNELEVVGDVELTNLYDNDASNFFDGGCSATTTMTGIDSTGAITCTTITGVAASSLKWNSLTDPDAASALTLNMSNSTTAFNWSNNTTAANNMTFSLSNTGGTAGTDNLLVLSNAVSTATTGDLNTESLLLLDQADTTVAGTTALDNALLITNSGGSTLTDAIHIGSTTQVITNGINMGGSTGLTTDLVLQNSETIDNNVDGTLNIGATILGLTGTTSMVSNQTTFDLLNTLTTTINFAGVAQTLNIAAGGSSTRSINLGTGTGVDTINIGTGGTSADDINLGGLATSHVDLTGVMNFAGGTTYYVDATGNAKFNDLVVADSGNPGLTIGTAGTGYMLLGGSTLSDAAGNLTLDSDTTQTDISEDLSILGGDLLTSQTTATLFNTTATTLSLGGAATTLNILGAGSSTITIGNQTGSTGITTYSGTATQTHTSSATSGLLSASAFAFNANSLTTGTGMYVGSSSLASGKLVDLQVSGTAASVSQTALNILTAGANSTAGITTYGAQISNTHTNGTSGTNIGLYLNASGATTANYGLLVNSGKVGIGNNTPSAQLDITGNSALTSTEFVGINLAGTQSTANTQAFVGIKSNPLYNATSGNTLAGLYGISAAPNNANTGTITNLYGANFAPSNLSSGTIGSLYGLSSIPLKSGTGAITDVYGLYSRIDNTNATGAITNAYGLYLADSTETGTITNDFGLYQVDTAALNYFGGKVGIGNNNPNRELIVSGGTSGGLTSQVGIINPFGATATGVGMLFQMKNSTETTDVIYGGLSTIIRDSVTTYDADVSIRGQVAGTLSDVGTFSAGSFGIMDNTPTEATLVVGAAGAGNIYATFATANTERLCWDAAGASLITDCTGTPGDYAEEYGTTDATIEAGDIVSTDFSQNGYEITKDDELGSKAWIIKSNSQNQSSTLGIISTNPNEVIGQNYEAFENPRPVALSGRVPVKISPLSSPIQIGDAVTSSSDPGKGVKATTAGKIVGIALENWNPSSPTDKILVFVNNNYHNPELSINETGELALAGNPVSGYEVTSNETIVDKIAGFAKVTVANLTAGLTRTNELQVANISPLSSSEPVRIDGPVVISPSTTTTTPTLTVDGEIAAATISAREAILTEVSANTITATNIYADTITANHIEGLDAKIATLSADLTEQEITSITDRIKARLDQLTGDIPSAADVPLPSDSTDLPDLIIPSEIATSSASLTSANIDFATINNYLAVIGTATITTLDVTNELYANSISSKTNVLALQSTGGIINLAKDTLIVDSQGEVMVNGNLSVNGQILANSASLGSLELGTPSATSSALGNLLAIYDESGRAVATIDASGSATLASLTTNMITIASSGDATSSSTLSSDITSNATAGESILVSPDTELTIYSPHVTKDTLVYLTPTTNTENKVLFVKSKVSCEDSSPSCTPSFTVGIDAPASTNISFNWWIIKLATPKIEVSP